MDALRGIGHACGHNLIGMSGVAVAISIRAALEKHDIPGKVVLLGTPAEEGGSGKVKMLEAGAYDGMAACLIAHAALSPWEGRNALDAAVLGYNNISALRQQLRPTHRVHGIFEGKDWAPNKLRLMLLSSSCYVRAPTRAEMLESVKRVIPCFEAAGLATGCEVSIKHEAGSTFDLRQNTALGGEVANIVLKKYGAIDYEWGIKSASTDFGNVTYAIPTIVDGGNHTLGFTASAKTTAAHYAALDVSKALAATGVRVVLDDSFFAKVQASFKEDEQLRGQL
ncbi:hypothetical protein D9619_009753 [Psilocybe cf. subviscida]|uniref:Peptidase M20 dimerisation domain-containing protein n=1 Tax=Psilocybe cf. subviscida TaxID=2480587 RepID=A0A8H5BLA2_9AGAR|nr:hypothetical protein D9619_009753 [Psilocybe cf. subviscida]